MGKLDGKVAVITGGASGIGAATAKLFVAEGAKVLLADIQDAAGQALATQLGACAAYRHTDVTQEAEIEALVRAAVERFGRLDIFFNNAGAFGARGSITEISLRDYDATLNLLLRSVFLGMKHAGKVLATQKSGVILSTSSIAGLDAGRGPHLYSVAKSAVVQLTKSVALELGEQGVRVNCICPGGVATPFVLDAAQVSADVMPVLVEKMSQAQPLQRAGQAEDVARAALWLCSDEADFVTGHALVVDGGEGLGVRWPKQKLK